MTFDCTGYHPYRIKNLTEYYDDRAAWVASRVEAIKLHNKKGGFASEIAELQNREYGGMSDTEFRHRISLTKAVHVARAAWAEGGEQIVDIDLEIDRGASSATRTRNLQLHHNQSIFVFGADAIERIEGLEFEGIYIRRVGFGSDETCLLIMIGQPSSPHRSLTLGEALIEQSRIVIALAPAIAPNVEIDVIAGDQDLLTNSSAQTAFDAFAAFLSPSPTPSHDRSAIRPR